MAEEIDFPSDAQRMDRIGHLINNGFEDKVLIAQDIHTKHRLVINLVYSLTVVSLYLELKDINATGKETVDGHMRGLIFPCLSKK